MTDHLPDCWLDEGSTPTHPSIEGQVPLWGLPRDAVLEWLTTLGRHPLLPSLQPDARLDWVVTGGPSTPPVMMPSLLDSGNLQPYPRFAAPSLTRELPEPLRQLLDARRDLEPGLVEGLELLLSPASWLVQATPYLFDALSPSLEVLGWLLEKLGVDQAVHGGRRETFPALVDALPGWLPQRGALEPAVGLLEAVAGMPLRAHVRGAGEAISGAEALLCHSLDWYAHRFDGMSGQAVALPGEPPQLRESVALLSEDHARLFPFSREDVQVDLPMLDDWLEPLLRLLPVWASLRLRLTDDAWEMALYLPDETGSTFDEVPAPLKVGPSPVSLPGRHP